MTFWWSKDTFKIISATSLTLSIFAIMWPVCGWPRHWHGSMLPLLSFPQWCGQCVVDHDTDMGQCYHCCHFHNSVSWPVCGWPWHRHGSMLAYHCCHFHNYVASVWLTTTLTWVNATTAVISTTQCHNPPRFHPLPGSILNKHSASYFHSITTL